MKKVALIRIVDDDPSLRKSLSFLLNCEGYQTVDYAGAHDFLTHDSPSRPGCLILDVQMPEISGVALQKELNRRASTLPIIFLTAHGDIDMAVQSMHDGAFDFQQKPIDPPRLINAVARAVKKSVQYYGFHFDVSDALNKYQQLTERENEVLRLVAQGFLNRQIAEKLAISVRTVETQRASAKRKLQIDCVSELSAFFENIDSLLSAGHTVNTSRP
ncbi:MAG: response regulator [Candidatus Aphodousia sp.]|nr:response regulator [Sutterella sp.]MDY2899166.1 response regulator [Candidatus Aphodousia sp.]